MRMLLLSLALFYAWQPAGLCACRLQAMLMPPSADAQEDEPCDDDHDDPRECHCAGAKKLCILHAQVAIDESGLPSLPAISPAALAEPFAAANSDRSFCPFGHAADRPIYLTVRALRI